MNESSGAEFDPRFDPAFQPGFDPDRHPTPTRSRPSSTRSDPAGGVADLLAPAAPSEPTAESPIIRVPEADAPAVVDAEVATARPDAALIALWIVSAVFVAAGIYGLRLISDRVAALTSSGGFGGPDYYLLQAYTFGAPLLIALGLATATGTLFLVAARRLRR